MTALGLYFSRKSINRSEVARKTGINKTRLSELSNQEKTHLRAEELYLIALAIDVDPGEMFIELHQDLKLPEEK
ncbi:putative transcriptional regulator [Leeuwenhoekiella aestuarii]|uniref:Putative transcriptional regulator n=1 Tax=Leeuwenhoekiella aestuarii TaxID=2249426 RepID=A0A4Q0NS57_9FLAO|nr:helix-turn-helix transcriptional regulator [Leeuwenhoekiella aestuarii]RXG13264.1 putative transcriptional regulator [Leeuwenhoekiella aestuarii]RXG15004.1 putative transcriptional regulator [Leeuwenhoekiella aestuarii]